MKKSYKINKEIKNNDYLKKLYPFLKQRLGNNQAKRVLKQTCRNLEILLQENPSEPPRLAEHTVKRIYPTIAAFRAIEKATGNTEYARKLITDSYAAYCQKPAKMIRAILKLPGLYRKFPMFFYKVSRKSYSEEAGFAYRLYPCDHKQMRFDIIKCPYVEVTQKYDCPELAVSFCASDDVCYGNMHPKLIWGRTKTIAHGADCCDFKLTRK